MGEKEGRGDQEGDIQVPLQNTNPQEPGFINSTAHSLNC